MAEVVKALQSVKVITHAGRQPRLGFGDLGRLATRYKRLPNAELDAGGTIDITLG